MNIDLAVVLPHGVRAVYPTPLSTELPTFESGVLHRIPEPEPHTLARVSAEGVSVAAVVDLLRNLADHLDTDECRAINGEPRRCGRQGCDQLAPCPDLSYEIATPTTPCCEKGARS